ncbi:AraC family transcriptional regulator [Heyndrickxia coagulans]|nr:AraC family transcriptional regulator [Heyndrickxia coagulans]MED4344580.1 AraC family transcriptional regulator [Heyndrickxia coagulans]MED4494900.1 AraC family transcriptional regulator [Heyndrickxia coagulans]MED4966596.1 AraC family transcriptional regulator [Heyndrickxia coagulans]UYM83366.1 AraC family transcriptional regulator [Heyndrickxia coagulans]
MWLIKWDGSSLVGIADTPYFNRLFKRKTEMTPLAYRRNG